MLKAHHHAVKCWLANFCCKGQTINILGLWAIRSLSQLLSFAVGEREHPQKMHKQINVPAMR